MNQTELNKQFEEAKTLYETKQFKKAASIYKKLAKEGHSEAQLELGQLYLYNGLGVKRNEDKAIEWMTKAADQGNNDAQGWLNITLYQKKERESLDPNEVILAYSYKFDMILGKGGTAKEEISALGIKCEGELKTRELMRGFYSLDIYLPRKKTSDHKLFEKIHAICKKYGAE